MTGDKTIGPVTISIDCGGSGLKTMALDAAGNPLTPRLRVPTPYPLSPHHFVRTLVELSGSLPPADRLTVGMPGMIRHGVVIHTPHYVTTSGPGTTPHDDLHHAWKGFDAQAALSRAFGLPALVLNDAEVHGAGAVLGQGVELVLTLGTGLGSSFWVDGRLTPHLELSQLPIRKGRTYDQFIGEAERKRIGDARWSRRTAKAIAALQPVFLWDRVFVGGGGARRLSDDDLDLLAPSLTVIPNTLGITGGARAWDLLGPGH